TAFWIATGLRPSLLTRACLSVRDGKAGRDTSLARNDKKHSGFGLCRHLNRKRSNRRVIPDNTAQGCA
ncbi:MAG: hypothetical protein LBP58_02495, partial [Azoarcus sp.]|nr:hypothetical protein [Azoarcus sp.]